MRCTGKGAVHAVSCAGTPQPAKVQEAGCGARVEGAKVQEAGCGARVKGAGCRVRLQSYQAFAISS